MTALPKLSKLLARYEADFTSLLEENKATDDYLCALNIRVGHNDHDKHVEQMRCLGTRVLFLTGNRAMRNYDFLQKYITLFQKNGHTVTLFDNISSNPTLEQMKAGINVAKRIEPDFIFALGGGSVIDTAKVISVGCFGDVWTYVQKECEPDENIPIVAFATTSGTGSHVTPYAVVTNTDTLEKKTLKHPRLLPRLSIVDTDITQHMPRYTLASTGFDVLCHATEVFTRADCTPLVEEFCTRAIARIRDHLISSYCPHPQSSEDEKLCDKLGMVYADMYAGIALAIRGTHLAHAISHPISGRFPEITHGQALALVTPETTRRQIAKGSSELRQRYEFLSEALGGGKDFDQTVRNYRQLLGLEGESYRFETRDCTAIFNDTMGYRLGSVKRCPAGLSEPDIREIIDNSLLHKY